MESFTPLEKRFDSATLGSVDAKAIIGVVAGILTVVALFMAGVWYLQRRCTRRYYSMGRKVSLSTSTTVQGTARSELMVTPPPRYEPPTSGHSERGNLMPDGRIRSGENMA